MGDMKVFISSVMGEHFTPLRQAASDGIKALGYEPVWAEDYTASPASPQIVVEQPATDSHSSSTVVPAIIEESITYRISRALRFAGRTLDHLDQPQRVRHVAVAAAVLGGGYMPWRTREEQTLSPTSAMMNIFGQERAAAELSPPTRSRAALQQDARQMAEDLTVLLRRSATESPYQ